MPPFLGVTKNLGIRHGIWGSYFSPDKQFFTPSKKRRENVQKVCFLGAFANRPSLKKKKVFPGVPFFWFPEKSRQPNDENVSRGVSSRVTIQLWQSTQVTPSQLWPSAHWVQGTPGILNFKVFRCDDFFLYKALKNPGCDGQWRWMKVPKKIGMMRC